MPYSKDKKWLDSLFSGSKREYNNNAKSDSADDDLSIFPPIVRRDSGKTGSAFREEEPEEKKPEKKKKQSNNNAMLIKKTPSAQSNTAILPPIGPKTSSSTGDNSKDTQVRRSRPTSLKQSPLSRPELAQTSIEDHRRHKKHRKFDMLSDKFEDFLGRVDPATARTEYNRLRRLLMNQSEKVREKLEDIDQQRQRIGVLLEEHRYFAEEGEYPQGRQDHPIHSINLNRSEQRKLKELTSTVSRNIKEIKKNIRSLHDNTGSTEQGLERQPSNENIRRRIENIEPQIGQSRKKADHLKDQVDILIEKYNSFRSKPCRDGDDNSDGTASEPISEETQPYSTPREMISDSECQLPLLNCTGPRQYHNMTIPRSILKLDKSSNTLESRQIGFENSRPPTTGTMDIMGNVIKPPSKVARKRSDYQHSFGPTTLGIAEEMGIKETKKEVIYGSNKLSPEADESQSGLNWKKIQPEVDRRKVKRTAAWLEEVNDSKSGKKLARDVRRNMETFDENPLSGWVNESNDKDHVD